MRTDNGLMHAPGAAAANTAPAWIGMRAAAAFLLAYVAFDWLSFIHPMKGLNVTPWNPQAALAVGLLLVSPGSWWLAALAAMAAELLGRPGAAAWPDALLAGGALAAGYTVTAALLARVLPRPPALGTRRDFVMFLAAAALGALATAALHVAMLGVLGTQPGGRVLLAVSRDWIGQAVGLLVTLPLLMLVFARERRAALAAMARKAEWWVIALVAVAAVAGIFGRDAEDQFKLFYLLFVPVVWAAARFGVAGAVVMAFGVQVLVIAAVSSEAYKPLTVFEFQMLMAALAATGLLLGTTVDEREAAERRYRESLRAAAAGDMAAALAHELNQPLAALSGYARACELLVGGLDAQTRAASQPLADTARKLVAEASRASEVVKRLRDFFRERETQLEPVDLPALLGEIVHEQAARAAAMHVALQCTSEPALPPVDADPVQLSVVIRNLVANAIEAAAAARGERSVDVRAHGARGEVVVSVVDSGAGLAEAELDEVFEGRRSTKPGGMGIGLGISRAIVHAHNGRIWAEPGPGGRFGFSLPGRRA